MLQIKRTAIFFINSSSLIFILYFKERTLNFFSSFFLSGDNDIDGNDGDDEDYVPEGRW